MRQSLEVPDFVLKESKWMTAERERKTTRHRYGDERRVWHPDFVAYAEMVVRAPAYEGMPDAIDEHGQIRWNAPSNRPPGRWQDLHDRRLRWWEKKADEIGVARTGRGWASEVAKRIHPTGEKPCQTCGRVLSIRYVYPSARTLKKLNSALGETEKFEYENFLTIFEIVPQFITVVGSKAYETLEALFPELVGKTRSVESFLKVFAEVIVPSEPRGKLSPGAMSNAPDRLDGFHSYNLCCRHKQDRGRATENLRTYSVDRRAFEHWSEGDWNTASFLMTQTQVGACPICGRVGQLTADHIGPISLGFAHTPNFKVMCRRCNSTKGNRLTLQDVRFLLEAEKEGLSVISWQAKELWERCKTKVKTEQDAIRLGKLLRINQHHYLILLAYVSEQGYADILLPFLHPEYAEVKVEVIGLDRKTLSFKEIRKTPQAETYARSKAARMFRIAFGAVEDYGRRPKRNIQEVPAERREKTLKALNEALLEEYYASLGTERATFREKLKETLSEQVGPEIKDIKIRDLFVDRVYAPVISEKSLSSIRKYMEEVGCELSSRF